MHTPDACKEGVQSEWRNKENRVFSGSSGFSQTRVLTGLDRFFDWQFFKEIRTGCLTGSRFNRSDRPTRSESEITGQHHYQTRHAEAFKISLNMTIYKRQNLKFEPYLPPHRALNGSVGAGGFTWYVSWRQLWCICCIEDMYWDSKLKAEASTFFPSQRLHISFFTE